MPSAISKRYWTDLSGQDDSDISGNESQASSSQDSIQGRRRRRDEDIPSTKRPRLTNTGTHSDEAHLLGPEIEDLLEDLGYTPTPLLGKPSSKEEQARLVRRFKASDTEIGGIFTRLGIPHSFKRLARKSRGDPEAGEIGRAHV